jgi:transposase-like protein
VSGFSGKEKLMRETLKRLAAEVRRHRQGRDLQGVRYPASLRRAVVRGCEASLADGESVASVAEMVGIAPGTLGRWRSTTAVDVGLRPVELVETASPEDGRAG